MKGKKSPKVSISKTLNANSGRNNTLSKTIEGKIYKPVLMNTINLNVGDIDLSYENDRPSNQQSLDEDPYHNLKLHL